MSRSFNITFVYCNDKIDLLSLALQYNIPRIKQSTNEVSEDLPLFV